MKMTAELSVYPLRDDFKTAVLGFIDELLKGQDVVAVTNSMSTQISGEDEALFSAHPAGLARQLRPVWSPGTGRQIHSGALCGYRPGGLRWAFWRSAPSCWH